MRKRGGPPAEPCRNPAGPDILPSGQPHDPDTRRDPVPFDETIRARRQQLGLTLQQLARRSGVSAAMLSEVERGQKSPTLRVAAQIAEGLECAVSDLLDEELGSRLVVQRRRERRRLVEKGSGIERHLLAPPL